MFMPHAFYDACDDYGVLIYHDMQYAQRGHSPLQNSVQDAELRHQIRRLSHHVSIAMWDGCNECQVIVNTPTGIYATFVMTVVAQEDMSRPIWPSCPSHGWKSGAWRLSSLPSGQPLVPVVPNNVTIEIHGPYLNRRGFPAVNGHGMVNITFDPLIPVVF